jgi:hypothetical protein
MLVDMNSVAQCMVVSSGRLPINPAEAVYLEWVGRSLRFFVAADREL